MRKSFNLGNVASSVLLLASSLKYQEPLLICSLNEYNILISDKAFQLSYKRPFRKPLSTHITSHIWKCPQDTVMLTYWEASREVSELS